MEAQGTSPGTAGWLSQAIGTVGNVAGSYFGAQAAPAQTTVYAAPASSNNKTIYIVVGAVLLMLIVFLIVRKKK